MTAILSAHAASLRQQLAELRRPGTLVAIGLNSPRIPLGASGCSFGPTLDYHVKREGGGLSAIDGTVEYCPVDEGAVIMTGDTVLCRGFRSITSF